MAMSDDLKAIEKQVQEGLRKALTPDELEAVRVSVLGRKGRLTQLMHMMGKVPPEERPAMGKMANQVRAQVTAAIEKRRVEISKTVMQERFNQESIDVTLPGRVRTLGSEHLISQVRRLRTSSAAWATP